MDACQRPDTRLRACRKALSASGTPPSQSSYSLALDKHTDNLAGGDHWCGRAARASGLQRPERQHRPNAPVTTDC